MPRDPLAGTLASGEPGGGWSVPRFPADAFRVVNPWSVAASRYTLAIHDLSRDDEYGFSVPSLVWWHDRPLLLHMTCTGNTVLLASESTITGWSWTRTELGGVPLTFGPPPDWLAPLLSLSLAPQFQGSMAHMLETRGQEVHEAYLRDAVSWLTYEQCESLPEELRERIPPVLARRLID